MSQRRKKTHGPYSPILCKHSSRTIDPSQFPPAEINSSPNLLGPVHVPTRRDCPFVACGPSTDPHQATKYQGGGQGHKVRLAPRIPCEHSLQYSARLNQAYSKCFTSLSKNLAAHIICLTMEVGNNSPKYIRQNISVGLKCKML